MSHVESYYDQSAQAEWERLERCRTEFAVTMRVLQEYLPTAPAKVLDLGGGPGRYAIELAKQGYLVTLADVSTACLTFAKQKAYEAEVELVEYIHTDACDLSALAAEVYDIVLLMGPFYHLFTEEKRRAAIREALRVLRPEGLICATFIPRAVVFRWAALEAPEYVLEKGDAVLATGLPSESLEKGHFPGYFADPGEVQPLLESEGCKTLALVGCEGVVSHIDERVHQLSGAAWEKWVEINYQLGCDRHHLGASDHLLYVGKKSRA
jgi:S-adenosylmethionine-dependent methyltransferase